MKKSWELSENQVTEEKYFNRRKFLKTLAIAGSVGAINPRMVFAEQNESLASRLNPQYQSLKEKVTAEKLFVNYNNFYEFSTDKEAVRSKSKDFKPKQWSVEIKGLVNKPMVLDLDDIYKKFPIEERIYRFRCVETWSAVVPWNGFELKKLLALVDPKPEAKFVKFTTFFDPEIAPNQRSSRYYKWPYTEGLRLDEARNELVLLAVGLYGKKLLPQNGIPIRLVVPWKYGFKSIKSIVSIELTKEQPKTLWNITAPKEYGFYANVNPNVHHPRWSQAHNKPLGEWFSRENTLVFNGYEEQVARLYRGMDLAKFY